jgi:general secretion pathway protein M
MIKLGGEQAIALGALGGVLLACVLAVALSIGARFDAQQERAERHEILSHLQVQARQQSAAQGPLVTGKAPGAAFLDAPTLGLAGAQLQSYITRLATAQQAALMSSGVESPARDDTPDSIRVQATLELSLKSLQAMLQQLETGTPYVFVETLAAQPAIAAQRGAEDPPLRVTVGVRALWRRRQT